ncbi:hypothetical protein GCK72_024839 [Caenorhabditis remanei]|uniref:Uncharacterized protein n=1 Tax=Caenorhabditis remanei TaxID=31234 RepID=A0A6A5G132_CAERE|nr:hypothetical protein GCK72_024839 [Caenorhabditis remanei]KAF1748372.1 hypothetical protein GCK72_024839 [Caenorhabditis remanei]
MPPSWEDLPVHFKHDVVRNLDFESRCCFRKCCHAERQLVDEVPLELDKVNLEIEEDGMMLRVDNTAFSYSQDGNENRITVTVVKNSDGDDDNDEPLVREKYLHHVRQNMLDLIMTDFLLLFINGKSVVRKMEIIVRQCQAEEKYTVYETLRRKLQAMQPAYCINTKKVEYYLSAFEDTIHSLRLLNENYLETIAINTFTKKIMNSAMESVFETRQWKMAKHVQITNVVDIPIRFFTHLQLYNADFAELSLNDLLLSVQSFYEIDASIDSHFQLYYHNTLDTTLVSNNIASNFKNTRMSGNVVNIPMRSGNSILAVKFLDNRIIGHVHSLLKKN